MVPWMLALAQHAPLVLVVESESGSGSSLLYSLEAAGYRGQVVDQGQEALRLVEQMHPDLVLLDLALPDISGFEICRRIRMTDGPQPVVIIVTAKNQETDRVAGFEVGADDFVTKPFSVRELMLRIQVRMQARRASEEPSAPAKPVKDDHIIIGPLEIDCLGHHVFLHGRELNVSAQEMRLLSFLASTPGKMHARQELLSEVWGYRPDATSRTLDTHIKRLRDKLGNDAAMIQTVHGVGYRLIPPTSSSVTPVASGTRRRR
jgi:two-component system, OmpR family, phosphate regulon response regulator PhoB